MNKINTTSIKRKLPIEVDVSKRIIRIGKWVANDIYYNNYKKESFLDFKIEILKCNDIDTNFYYSSGCINKQKANKYICEYLGPSFYKYLRKVSMELWIDPVRELADKYCFKANPYGCYTYDKKLLKRMWDYLPLVKQADSDKLDNIMPFIIYFGQSPQELKKNLGRKVWKTLCSKKHYFNRSVINFLLEYFNPPFSKNCVLDDDKILVIRIFSQLKASLVKNASRLIDMELSTQEHIELLTWLNQYSRVSSCNALDRHCILYNDTKHMASQLNEDFYSWSLKKMKLKHDKFSKAITAREYSTESFSWITDELKAEIMIDEVIVKTLHSPYLMAQEGRYMGHCLASYIGHVSTGHYLAFSLESCVTHERSTVGMLVTNQNIVIEQQEARFGFGVSDKRLLNASEKLCLMLNKKRIFNFKKAA